MQVNKGRDQKLDNQLYLIAKHVLKCRFFFSFFSSFGPAFFRHFVFSPDVSSG